MLPATADRVPMNTSACDNGRIRQRTEANVARYAAMGPHAIERRLVELDYEWDVERYLETMAPSVTLTGLFLGTTVSRKWLLLPIAVQGMFLLHALQGWCPPLPLLRKMGVRTSEEINEERMALKTLRGDFRQTSDLDGEFDADEALAAARK
jgi:hypothetical protein